MAPEQATSRSRIGPETDVWALGLMAFHLLTGRHYWYAFNHDAQPTPMEVGVEVLTAPLESASARAVSLGVGGLLPPGFDAWFARCVARDRGARFRDATECITALREALVGRAAQPPTARTTPAAPRLPGPMPMQTGAGFASFEVPVSFVAPGPVAPHNVRSQPTPSTRHDPWAGAATSGRTEAPTHSSGKSADGARDVSKQHSRLSIATMTMITALALSASGYWGWNQLQSARLSNAGESALNTNSPTTYPTTRLEAATPSYARSEQARPVVLLHPDTTRASSFIQLREGSFPPSLAFDSDPNTAWNEAAPGHGRGEWIEAGFNRPVVVRSVEFATGWNATSSRGTDLFHGNARLRRVRISFSSGRFIDRETGSEERVHRVVSLSERTTTVRITAMEVWPGTRWEDLAISDISIRGTHD
jgi:serine/threonine protein kinase